MISERTTAGLARSKKRLGMRSRSKRSKAFRRWAQTLSVAAKRKAAMEREEAYRVHIEWALRQSGTSGRPISVHAAAAKLNERNIESPMDGRWWGSCVMRMGQRLELHHPLAGKGRMAFQKPRGVRWGMD